MTEEIQVDAEHLNNYYDALAVICCLLLSALMGFGLILLVLYFFFFRSRILILSDPESNKHHLRYALTDEGIEIEDSWFLLKSQKVIPWKKVVGVERVQGPLMQFCKVSTIRILTAADGYGQRNIALIGMQNPQDVYDKIRARIAREI